MNRSVSAWLAPLTGVGFVVLTIISFAVVGEPPDAGESPEEIVEHYVDNKDAIMVGTFIGIPGVALLVFFFSYLRNVLREAEGAGGMLSLVAFGGALVLGVGAAIDGTISFALADRADDITPESAQTLQALWDNDFIPFVLGQQLLWWSVGLSIVRHKALPVWLGWVALVFAVASLTPAGFFAFLGGAIWVLIVSIMLTMQARSGPAAPAAPAA
jgi:hypothetical protein